jgi:hypothetical protein
MLIQPIAPGIFGFGYFMDFRNWTKSYSLIVITVSNVKYSLSCSFRHFFPVFVHAGHELRNVFQNNKLYLYLSVGLKHKEP